MSDKAEHILNDIKKRDRKGLRRWTRLQATPHWQERVLSKFNQSTLDDVGPMQAGDQEMKVLKEMNELQDFEHYNWSKGSQ